MPNVVISSIPLSRISASVPEYLLGHEYSTNDIQGNESGSSTPDEQQHLLCIASAMNPGGLETGSSLSTVYAGSVPLIPGYFSGVGDLFSALLLGHFRPPRDISTSPLQNLKVPSPLATATAHALYKTHAILSLTHGSSLMDSLPATDDELDAVEPQRKSKRMKGRELKLIQGQDIFRSKDPVEGIRLWEGFWD